METWLSRENSLILNTGSPLSISLSPGLKHTLSSAGESQEGKTVSLILIDNSEIVSHLPFFRQSDPQTREMGYI
jgi:hypothetical protein